MRLLILAYFYPPDPASGSARPKRWVSYLSRLGYVCDVIAWGEGGEAQDGEGRIVRVPHSTSRISRWFQRIMPYNERLEWTAAAVDAATRLMAAGRRYDAVISTSPPLSVHMAARRIRARAPRGMRWIADYRDPVVGNPFRNRGGLAPLLDRWMESAFVHDADATIANTEAAGEALRQRYPSLSSRIHVVWNGYDPEDALPDAAAARGDRRGRTFVHTGNLYGGRRPDTVLRSLLRLEAAGRISASDVQVRLIGQLENRDAAIAAEPYASLIRKGMLAVSQGAVPRQEAMRELAESDYPMLLDLNEKNAGLQVPAKLFEYLRIGRPVLAVSARGSMSRWILERAGVPFAAVDPRDSDEEIDRRLVELLSRPSTVTAPNEWFERTFHAEVQARQLDVILRGQCS